MAIRPELRWLREGWLSNIDAATNELVNEIPLDSVTDSGLSDIAVLSPGRLYVGDGYLNEAPWGSGIHIIDTETHEIVETIVLQEGRYGWPQIADEIRRTAPSEPFQLTLNETYSIPTLQGDFRTFSVGTESAQNLLVEVVPVAGIESLWLSGNRSGTAWPC